MIRVAIVEDDPGYTRTLEEYLNRYAAEHGVSFDLRRFSDGDEIAEGYRAGFDIIFMDVEMPFLNGMDAAREIRRSDPEVVIIFITNMPQYAIQGYKVDALDYVLKPISYFAFSQRIDRALTRISKKKTKFVTIQMKGGKGRLDVSLLCYVEVRDHDLIYHTVDGDIEAKGTMKDAEEILAGEHFFRCSRCYLVNLEYVDNFQGSDATVNGDVIQISRPRKKAFLDALNQYMNEVGK